MISRKYFLVQSSLMALLLTGTLCASSTSTMLAPEACDEAGALRISQAASGQEPDENAPPLTGLLPELLKTITTKVDKKSWDNLKITCKTLYETSMGVDVLLARGSTFVIQSADDLKEISERFYKNAPCHVPITFKYYSPTDEDLKSLTNATQVTLSWCQGITDKGLANLINATHVTLEGCEGITDEALVHLSNAIHVNLLGCQGITNKGLEHLTKAAHVTLKDCRNITDEGLKYLTNATHINLLGCRWITDEGLKYLVNAIHVTLTRCEKITDAGLVHLTNAAHVDLSNCDGITNEGLKHLSNATHMNLHKCKNITNEAKEALRQRGVIVTG